MKRPASGFNGDDVFAVEVALEMEEGLPLPPIAMLRALERVEKKWPQFRARCTILRARIIT